MKRKPRTKRVIKKQINYRDQLFKLIPSRQHLTGVLIALAMFSLSVGIAASSTDSPMPVLITGRHGEPLVGVYRGVLSFYKPPCEVIDILKELNDPQGASPWIKAIQPTC
jgi:hypothetical protein